jgi:hypothetical protein
LAFRLLLSILHTCFLDWGGYKSTQDSIRGKRLSYIDFFTLELNKAVNAFDLLIADLDEGRTYQHKNIESANNALTELRKMTSEVVIFSDEHLREKIITTIDDASVLVGEIRAIEIFKEQGETSHKNINDSVSQELRKTTLELLKINIAVDLNTYEVSSIGKPAISEEKKKEVTNLFKYLNVMHNNSQQDLDRRLGFCKDKRTVLSTRILDSKTKINSLLVDLTNLKEKTQARRFFFF